MDAPFRLLDLPDEILFITAEYLESSRKDLRALACTCVRISEIADRYCYRRVLIRSEDQFKRLSNSIQRKPKRLTFIQEVVLVPAAMINLPYLVLLSANMLQDLTVELPFHEDYLSSAGLKREYQDPLGELFEDASFVGCVPKPRPFQWLRSCKLNFQQELAKPWSLGKHSMLFLHDNLVSLTLVAASIGPHDVDYLRHYKKLTPLSRLHLDHCDISPQALAIILSVPRTLQSLELTEYCYRDAFQYALCNHEELVKALSPQEDSLRDLQLGLRFHPSAVQTPYDFCNFARLRQLTVECMGLDNLLYCPLALKDRLLQITLPQSPLHVISTLLPERPFSLIIQTPPGYRLDVAEDQMVVERLGRFLKTPLDYSSQSTSAFGIRLIIVRQTEPRMAVPPYLYNEHVPEKVVCYDSYAPISNWNFRTDMERQVEEHFRRLRDTSPFRTLSTVEQTTFIFGPT